MHGGGCNGCGDCPLFHTSRDAPHADTPPARRRRDAVRRDLPARQRAGARHAVQADEPHLRLLPGQSGDSDQPRLRRRQGLGGAQPFYDWAGINQANANGNHQAVVPDGQLCSGGNSKYRGLDLDRSDWTTSLIRADASGRYTFEFLAPAPHATREWKFYVTRDGWKAGDGLRWSDLEAFCTLGNVPLREREVPASGRHYRARGRPTCC
nr:lytic polysaccharide monooxygenase auxiliary activity family 9 protein [Stenotrophomonas sp. 9(2022)]